MDLKLVKIASVREHMDSHYRGKISYSKAVDLINKDANKQLELCNVVEQSEQLSHKAKVLRKEEVEANRSSAYKYIDL